MNRRRFVATMGTMSAGAAGAWIDASAERHDTQSDR